MVTGSASSSGGWSCHLKPEGPYWRANHIQRQVWFSSFHMGDDRLHAYAEEIRRRKLRFLEGYPVDICSF